MGREGGRDEETEGGGKGTDGRTDGRTAATNDLLSDGKRGEGEGRSVRPSVPLDSLMNGTGREGEGGVGNFPRGDPDT